MRPPSALRCRSTPFHALPGAHPRRVAISHDLPRSPHDLRRSPHDLPRSPHDLPRSPQVLTLAASVLFALPLVRELVLWTRCIDAGKRTASKALSKARARSATISTRSPHTASKALSKALSKAHAISPRPPNVSHDLPRPPHAQGCSLAVIPGGEHEQMLLIAYNCF